MIKLPDGIFPSKSVLDKLKDYQDKINELDTFPKRSEKAKKSFSSANKIGNKTFDAVKESLTEMCSGARRCVYCEDSVGDEVEHIRPKDLFPDSCFVWENYVYACGPCNGPKNNKFAVYRNDSGCFFEVNSNPGIEPPIGEDALINPRNENGMDYCMLDLRGTFKFVILSKKGTRDYEKADYTFNNVLRLNDQREYLRRGRMLSYGNYKSRLDSYTNKKKNGADQAKLDSMIQELKSESHPTVWKEMQRYFLKGFLPAFDQDLHDLFVESPEALNW